MKLLTAGLLSLFMMTFWVFGAGCEPYHHHNDVKVNPDDPDNHHNHQGGDPESITNHQEDNH